MKVKVDIVQLRCDFAFAFAASGGHRIRCHDQEHICWDPKDGELCLSRVKPGETLVEARSDSDVQIDRQIWV